LTTINLNLETPRHTRVDEVAIKVYLAKFAIEETDREKLCIEIVPKERLCVRPRPC